jgi:hypothetical protein
VSCFDGPKIDKTKSTAAEVVMQLSNCFRQAVTAYLIVSRQFLLSY